ncbi:hypothetical protein D9615_005260 [Tricholomella constricta]|uniref:Uncharacterized protein n=1 Tax=Tricholomella constricta TaxID=117010 RepID=A0A8H5M1V8_9AGAR|nr:hypothetical protein D9615_005260 [Tricholomella constricta]
MVGRLAGRTNKQTSVREPRISDPGRPPPPYDPSPNLPIIVAETTTTRTEVVTTTTTTHFFSLPLWRKRPFASASSSRQSTLDPYAATDEHGMLPPTTRSSVLMVEKDLPPTPPDEGASSSSQQSGLSVLQDHLSNSESRTSNASLSSTSPSNAHPTSTAHESFSATPSTAALARATLGLGLPHVLPHVSPPSSSSEVNSVAFTQAMPPQESTDSSNTVRRSKSTQKLRAMDIVSPNIPLGEEEHIRTRGLSFTTGSILLQLGKADTKGKAKEQDAASDRQPTSPQMTNNLARRASFWSRKKSPPQEPSVHLSPPELLTPLASQLPVLHPVSPFSMNITITPSSPSPVPKDKGAHSRGLSRSHSAGSSLRSPPLRTRNNSFKDRLPGQIERSAPSSSRKLSASPVPLSSPSTEVFHELGSANQEINVPKSRRRAQTNPPLLNRLSLGWLQTSHNSPPPPLPRLSNLSFRPHTSCSTLSDSSLSGRQNSSPLFIESPNSSNSSRPSLEKGSVTTVPLPSGKEESPEVYLKHLQATVSKAEVAGILASSSDPFYAQALRTYIGQFNFVDDPLDVALRKLLMEVGLPCETQQIDRVIEAFAGRYLQCNPALFTSGDHPYILAFSLIMLHTDAFNKSNKRKMSKADYIKNTRLPGVAPEVLDCFYDNIVFAPFIFIEDPLDINGQRGLAAEASNQSISASSNSAGTLTTTGTPLMRATKVDPYYLITNGLLGPLRVDVETFVPKDSPYSYEGTAGPWNESQLQLAFAKASQIEVGASTDAPRASTFFSLGAGGGFASPLGNLGTPIPTVASSTSGDAWTLKLTKVGLLNRKDDVLERGKRASNRKWRQWSVVLTGSQLLFFRDPSWASSLLAAQSVPSDRHTIFPQSALFKPDELLSVKDAIAVYDKSYTKYENTLRFLLADGRQLLLQALNETDLNDWIAGINYASAFKSAGVRMRPLEMSGIDVKLTGVAAATSHLHDLQIHSAKPQTWDGDAPRDLMGMLSGDSDLDAQQPPLKRKLTIVTDRDDMDLEVPIAPEIDGAEQFKATFDQVKADLAAGRLAPSDVEDSPVQQTSPGKSLDFYPSSAISAVSDSSRLPSRAQIMQSKIEDLDSRITAVQSQLEANMRFVRNIATLTPFQKSTRDRLTAAVQSVAQRVAQVRLENAKLVCHRNVLINDLASEGRSWHRAKALALRAATETLQSRHYETLPRMTLSYHASDPIEIPLGRKSSSSYHLDPSPTHRPESSICDSFHSAMDFGPDWPSSEDASSSFLGAGGHLFDSPSPSTSPSLHSHSMGDGNAESPRRSLVLPPNFQRLAESRRTSNDMMTHERFYTAPESPEEEAEKWDQTRCAQRVSLVRLPSDIQLTSRFGRHSQQATRNA